MKGFLPVLTLIFITLKLMGYINWSWWLVLLPLYGGIALVVIISVIAAVASALLAHRGYRTKLTVKRSK